MSKMLSGTPVLMGDNTIPGIKLHKELVPLIPKIEQASRDFGLDYFPIVVEIITYSDMAELASYGGFPNRYPHWQFGMEYEELSRGYEYGQYRISEMVVNCLGLKAPVLTNQGTIKARDVKPGMKVWANGWRDVVLVKEQPAAPVLSICAKGLAEPIICSMDHKWWTLESKRFYWKEAKSIKSGDVLVGNKITCQFERAAELKWNKDSVVENTIVGNRWRLKDINPPEYMTEELAELIGVIVGDGHISENNNVVSVVCDKKLPEFSSKIQDLFLKVFGVKSTEHSGQKSVYDHGMFSKMAVDFLDKIGLPKDCRFDTKEIPWSILESGNKYRAAFIRGYFDTDGYACGVLGCSSKSLNLIKQIQVMLLEMGICSNFQHINNEHNNIYALSINGKWNKRKFESIVGFSLDYKSESLSAQINKGESKSGGIALPYFQKHLIKMADKLNLRIYGQTKLYRRIEAMRHKSVGINVLYGCVEALEKFVSSIPEATAIRKKLDRLKTHLETPYFKVESVEVMPDEPTIDIALVGEHDFTAYGLVTHNTSPCYIYCMDSNSLVDNVDVIFHAIGHNDFFKNNVFFEKTNRGMMDKLANHGSSIRKYMRTWGDEKVTAFIDDVLRIQTLIDPASAWKKKKHKEAIIRDKREYHHPNLLRTDHNYMDPWLNPESYLRKEKERVERQDMASQLDLFEEPQRDVFAYLKDNAPLKPWQQDIISMLYEEAIYFAPQRQTKMLNEGWASYIDYHFMCKEGYASMGQKSPDAGIFHYAKHKMQVLGGKYSQNPYKLGFELLLDIEDRYNKGKFGEEYEACTDMQTKKNWNKNLGLGKEKLFEVRKVYNDYTAIQEFFTPEFCQEKEFYEYERFPNGEWVIMSKDHKRIKKKMLERYQNGGLPYIRLVDPNHRGKKWFLLEHVWDGRALYDKYVREVLTSIYKIWGHFVVLTSKSLDGRDIVYLCDGIDADSHVNVIFRDEYEKKYMK